MNEQQTPTVLFEGGPRDGETDTVYDGVVVIGTGREGGVYQRTDERRDGMAVYRWQMLTAAEAAALVDAHVRSSQEPER